MTESDNHLPSGELIRRFILNKKVSSLALALVASVAAVAPAFAEKITWRL